MNPIACLFTEANNECIKDSDLVTQGTCRAIAYYFEMSSHTFTALIDIGKHEWKHVQKKRSDPTQTLQMMISGEVLLATDELPTR